MTSDQPTSADNTQQTSDQSLSESMAVLKGGVAVLLSEKAQEQPIKSYVDIVAEMTKETKVSEVKDVNHMIELYTTQPDTQAAKDEGEPAWYNPYAMWYAAYPCRQARGEFTKQLFKEHKEWIRDDWKGGNLKLLDYACGTGLASQALAPHVAHVFGIDRAKDMVEMYNEIVKRQEHPTCAMRAYVGNLMPQEYTGVAPGVAADRSVREAFMKFDLAVISLGVDGFETLGLSPKERHHQLVLSLTAITESLNDQGSLLILDIQRATDQTGPNVMGLINGYKTCGYHSSDVVKALEALAMDEIEVVDNKRFQWAATEEESKIWFPAEANEVFFMLKAKRGKGYNEIRRK